MGLLHEALLPPPPVPLPPPPAEAEVAPGEASAVERREARKALFISTSGGALRADGGDASPG